MFSVPARPISEGAAPCPYWLAPCLIYTRPARIIIIQKKNQKKINFVLTIKTQNVIGFLSFQTADVKMLVKCLQMCAHVLSIAHKTKFWLFTRKSVPDFVSFAH